jgi:hypothetical protein
MVPDDRSSAGNSMGQFDFNSQAGVLAVLGAIRGSNLNTADRNELRDLVFLYSNGGGDSAVRTMLEERLLAQGVTPSLLTITKSKNVSRESATYSAGFATGRPAPVFTLATTPVSQIVPAPEPQIIPPNLPVLTPAPPVPVAPIIPTVVAAPVLIPDPVVVVSPIIPIIPPTPPTPITPTKINSEPPLPAPVIPAVIVESPVAPPSVPAPVLPSSVTTSDARLERIRAIKSDVNGQIGNPVNLVDINNDIGREYMSALLEAMKLLSSASEAESARAMSRLESVYRQVQSLLANPEPLVVPVTSSTVLPPREPLSDPVEIPSELVERSKVVEVKTPPQWGEDQSVTDFSEFTQASTPRPGPGAPPPVPVVPIAPLVSVAAAQAPLRTLADLPTADEVNNVSTNGSPLYTKEIDDGLDQLLSEWSLFKKSGLFGTGPSGREHPVFVKIASLQIPVLLAGRFEGATQEIKQSITDYMNGWRYEQGIIYEKGETFEQYLRRVIRHIIDWQNKKSTP